MIRLFGLCVVLALAFWLGIHLHQEQGLVFIAVGGKSYEMSLWVGFVLLLLIYFVLSFVFWVFRSILGVGGRFHRMGRHRRAHRSRHYTDLGLIELAKGNWKTAEKNLILGAKGAKNSFTNYLAAARAAHAQNREKKRDEYLSLAYQSEPSNEIAIGLAQAEMYRQSNQLDLSLTTLEHLQQNYPKNKEILRQIKEVALLLHDWKTLIKFLPTLKRHEILPYDDFHQLQAQVYWHLLKESSASNSAKNFQEAWQSLPKDVQYAPEIIHLYVQKMMDNADSEELAKLIRNALKKQWNEQLILLYGQLKTNQSAKRLSIAEGWLKTHPQSANLLLTCGRLAAQNDLFGKAERYLEACVHLTNNPEAYATLGLIYEKMGKTDLSADCFRKGMLESFSQPNNLVVHHQDF